MYQAGDLVWAKLGRHPWWPSLVCPSPTTLTFMKTTKGGRHFHVQFLSDKPTHAWVKDKFVNAFLGADVPECKCGGVYYSKKKTFLSALNSADAALAMAVERRFTVFCHGHQGVVENDELTASGKKRGRPKKRKETSQGASPSQPAKKVKLYKVGPKSIMRRQMEQRKYVIGVTTIPDAWINTYVLMNTCDIPEELTPKGYVILPEEQLAPSLSSEMDEDTSTVTPRNISVRLESFHVPQDIVEESTVHDDDDSDFGLDEEGMYHSEEDILGEDSEDEWCPTAKKKISLEKKRGRPTSKFKKIVKNTPKSSSKKSTKDSTSQSKSDSTPNKKTAPSSQTIPSQVGKNTADIIDLAASDNNGSEEEPVVSKMIVGDFMVEKEVVLSGEIKYIWRLKRGELLQKFERMEMEDGKIGYKNMVNFSDWNNSYCVRFVKLDCTLMYVDKVKKTEIFMIAHIPDVGSTSKQPASSSTTQSSGQSNKVESNKVQPNPTGSKPTTGPAQSGVNLSINTQEQEVTSTTSDSTDYGIGDFVIDKKDLRNVDNFSIWKIESNLLLRKFEPISIGGKMLHKPVKTYRGFKDISLSYKTIKVKFAGNNNVEVEEESRPKLYVNESMEEEYDKNPLLRHFYVYLQVILSAALEPSFMDNIKETQNPAYVLPLKEINKIISQKCTNIERKIRWTSRLQSALKSLPYLREVSKKDPSKRCEGCAEGDEVVEGNIFLFGAHYDPDTLQRLDTPTGQNLEFKIGATAMKNIHPYHQLCHFKFNLYGRCKSKIKLIQDSLSVKPDTQQPFIQEIMDKCLGNKYWVLQAFEEFIKLVELPYH